MPTRLGCGNARRLRERPRGSSTPALVITLALVVGGAIIGARAMAAGGPARLVLGAVGGGVLGFLVICALVAVLVWAGERAWGIRGGGGSAPARSVSVVPDGFTIQAPDGAVIGVRWDEIVTVRAYLQDLMTTDDRVLQFEVSGTPPCTYRVDEEVEGFAQVLDALLGQMPGAPERWARFCKLPAFSPEPVVIFTRTGVPGA